MDSPDNIDIGSSLIYTTIKRALNTDAGALIGRNGTIELEQMIQVNPHTLQILERNAGVFPIALPSIFYKWQALSIAATKATDVLATGWFDILKEDEARALQAWGAKAKQIPLRSLEPYYVNHDLQWTSLLEYQRVAVVTSFTKTAMKQSERLHEIWGDKLVIPNTVEWCWIQTGYSRAVAQGTGEWPPEIHTCIQAIDYVVAEVMKSGARFALIGCGGLGMPIAKALKDRGIIAIVLGGSIQVLFGIKGRRWETHSVISRFWNDSWVWPSKDETPANAAAIEGACYWA